MNYVAFEGVSQLDNLYVAATGKMKAATILLNPSAQDKPAVEEAITFQKKHRSDGNTLCSVELPENKCLLMFIMVWYAFIRFIYKTVYFYLFPYLIVPLSYIAYVMSQRTLADEAVVAAAAES